MAISWRGSMYLILSVQLVCSQWTTLNENTLGTKQEGQIISAYDTTDDTATFTLMRTVDDVVEKVVDIFETNDFDVPSNIFDIAQTFNLPYVQEIKLMFNTLLHLKKQFRSTESFRLIKDTFNYVKDSPFSKAIKSIVNIKRDKCYNNYNAYNYTVFSDLTYQCAPSFNYTDVSLRSFNFRTQFHYSCLDITCTQTKVFSPVLIFFEEEFHIRLTIDSYYRLSAKPNFYPMLLQLYLDMKRNSQLPVINNRKTNKILDLYDIGYLQGEMFDSCITSTYLKTYYKKFLNKQPVFAEPNKLTLAPVTRYAWYKGSYSEHKGHWKGREFWTGGMPDKCMRDYVDWSCPVFEDCWL